MAASARVPVTDLLHRLAAGKPLMGVAVTHTSVEVASLGPPYEVAKLLRTGRFLTPEELKAALVESQADAVLLGGSAAFRTDGSIQLGVRKLISGLRGLVYDTDWLPSPAAPGASGGNPSLPIWLCRRGQDDAAGMLVEHVRAHTTPEQRLLFRGMVDRT
ncbi:hypothetical protein GPECTOR_8g192 [Gonium pectorale]|uniref:Uncharacterized protein n=1 Tax=Gonium pectorale TaxID=33097 RepID=A0A150GSH2_GONPE|nr:hypothetical protein GPECTOR_8g192 [Gonium pectorale]|eukprot:KXZ52806.1 hypothetical protein GPECTOR_8g192 [Gonium pectorale]